MPKYDVLFDPAVGNAAWIDGPFRGPAGDGIVTPLSYCRTDDGRHWVACLNTGTLEVNMWDGAGSITSYFVGDFGTGSTAGDICLSSDLGTNEWGTVLLRTDGANVWLLFYQAAAEGFHNSTGAAISINVWEPVVAHFDGAEFVAIASSTSGVDNRHFDVAGIGSLVGRLAACASAAEPGVLYFAWQTSGSDDDLDWHNRQYHQRLIVAKADTAGLVWEYDLMHGTVRIEDLVFDPDFENYTDPILTQHLFLTNASGNPLLFWGKPTHCDTTQTAPPDIKYDTGEVYVIDALASSDGSAAVASIIAGTDYDATLTNLVDSGQLEGGIGGNYERLIVDGVDVIYVGIPFTSTDSLSTDDCRLLVGPADLSGPFTEPDGGTVTTIRSFFAKVIDEGMNIWMGSLWDGVEDGILHYHRVCPGVEFWGAFVPDAGDPVGTVTGTEFAISGDTLYVPGVTISPDDTRIGIMAVDILRNHGACGMTGLHVWQKI